MHSRELIKILKKDGWELKRTKGDHHHFKHPSKQGLITIPHPNKDLKKGTLNAILKSAGIKISKK